jgi:hypothetical protein
LIFFVRANDSLRLILLLQSAIFHRIRIGSGTVLTIVVEDCFG